MVKLIELEPIYYYNDTYQIHLKFLLQKLSTINYIEELEK